MNSSVAQDYRSAIAMLTASPDGHFVATGSGGIRTESNVAHLFAHRGVRQLQVDAEVGKTLLALYELALVSADPEQGLSAALVDPRQVVVAARFIAAHDAGVHSAVADSVTEVASLSERVPTIPQGEKNRAQVAQAMAAYGLDPVEMQKSAQAMKDLVSMYVPVTLSEFNQMTLGGGNIAFRALYEHPDCLSPYLPDATRFERYAAHVRPLIETDRQALIDSKTQWLNDRAREAGEPVTPELESIWELSLGTKLEQLERNADLGKLLENWQHTSVPSMLFEFINSARNEGLTVHQAMAAIRIWMGNGTQQLSLHWMRHPEHAPQPQEVGVLAKLVEQQMPITDAQKDTLLQFFPPMSS